MRIRRLPGFARCLRGLCIVALVAGLADRAQAAGAPVDPVPEKLHIDPNGTIHVDGLTVPPSDLLSAEARAQLADRLLAPPQAVVIGDGVAASRAATDQVQRAIAARWLAIYPAAITAQMMNGVQTDIVTPASGIAPENRRRVLINLHGGGFFAGARSGGQAEAVPVAGRGRITVVAVDYRLAPEHRFPAASEDVERVYRALLKTYRSANIGIYGCSAGGTLVAQSVAWFQQHDLPRPGAIGIFCSGVMPSFWYGGDAFALAPMLNGRLVPTAQQMQSGAGNLYLAGVDQTSPLVTPGLFPATLAQFPPTLLMTSTRDSALSNVLVSNARLLQAGVETQLFVAEGLGHGEFNRVVGTPEAQQAYDVIWRFFDRHLAR